MQSYLHITYDESPRKIICNDSSLWNYRTTPFSCSDIYETPIYDSDVLADDGSRKVYDLKFSMVNFSYNFNPGSTIGVLPSNDESLVNQLMVRLDIESICDKNYKLSILSNTTKKNACIPKHIPECGTLRNVFLHHVDVNTIPKKLFLKCLLHFVDDARDREELEFLCSAKGSGEYKKLISSYSDRSLLLLLNRFSSCYPPIEKLLELLPPLFPRVYSISSSPLNGDYFSITFNVDTFTNNEKGVCTGWLEKSINKYRTTKQSKIPLYFRTPSNFRLPNDNSIPIIMIATGTGIAPFKGFLEHRHLQIVSQSESFSETWLFYGCRDPGQNFLYKEEMQAYLKSGALSKLAAIIYVCGHFMNVLPEVRNSILNTFVKFRNLTREVAELYLCDLEKTHRYIVDNWN